MSVDDELISPEFRQEIIIQTIKDIARGNLHVTFIPTEWDEGSVKDIRSSLAVVGRAVNLYTAKDRDTEQLEKIEAIAFAAIADLRLASVLKPVESNSPSANELVKLNEKLDSNNKLLKSVLDLLKEIFKALQDGK